MHYLEHPVTRAKLRFRGILREMLICAAIAFVFLGLITRNFEIIPALLLTLLICPALWLIYRLVRFIAGY